MGIIKGGFIFFIIGILLIIARWKKFIIIGNLWIILCFVLWFILLYVSIHQKNKGKSTPQAVYVTNK